MPNERQPCSRFCFSFIWYCRLSTQTVAISIGSHLSPRAAFFADVSFEIFAEVLDRALQWLGSARSKRAIRMSGPEELHLRRERFDIARPPFALLHGFEDALNPR